MISKDFREFIELLNAAEVRYLVVGGYAVAVHGYQLPFPAYQLMPPPKAAKP